MRPKNPNRTRASSSRAANGRVRALAASSPAASTGWSSSCGRWPPPPEEQYERGLQMAHRQDAAQSAAGARSGPQDRQLPEQHPRAARGARGRRGRRDPARPRGPRDGGHHLQRLLRAARRPGHAALAPGNAGRRDPRRVRGDRPRRRPDPARGAARARGARRRRRGLHDQHAARGDAGHQPGLPRIAGEQVRKVADGKPGPISKRLRAAFRGYVERTHLRR